MKNHNFLQNSTETFTQKRSTSSLTTFENLAIFMDSPKSDKILKVMKAEKCESVDISNPVSSNIDPL